MCGPPDSLPCVIFFFPGSVLCVCMCFFEFSRPTAPFVEILRVGRLIWVFLHPGVWGPPHPPHPPGALGPLGESGLQGEGGLNCFRYTIFRTNFLSFSRGGHFAPRFRDLRSLGGGGATESRFFFPFKF